MKNDDLVSPYLMRPLRSLQEALRQRRARLAYRQPGEDAPAADNSNRPPKA
jgi:hypothetical protein